ncbi:MAG: glutathione peroxidase [Paludibacterium sp.]|uniref:glutathione peroxidase n=1 Tax=Paludibacterium sp. TaxID=1917523 RepID=UPI0025EC05D7|nr:glutathione peroxidase [Paludibacterium sp.]MBV8047426.1 glutathione peroxidase [Paludibacterium sp.]MBV8649274.1 glutathione peroxidase [Paludibacterium sp.]
MPTFHDFSVAAADGGMQSMSAYADKVVLVVNTASECGYTRQYAGLQELQQHFGQDPFTVLAFPCNQFGGQEPGGDAAILDFCQTRFGVTFPLMAKGPVNGPEASAVWQWLTQAGGSHPQPVKWNFTKFLIDQQGRLIKRYEPAVEPYELVDDINRLFRRG